MSSFSPSTLQAVDAPLELVAAAAERGGQFEFGRRHVVGKEERPARFLFPGGDIGQMAPDDGLANGLVREFRAEVRVALPALVEPFVPPLDGRGMSLQLREEAVEEIPDEEIRMLLVFKAGGRRHPLDLFQDEAARTGEKALQRS